MMKLRRSGLTLIEIMIALTMTLIVLGAMMSAFQYASAEMQNGRAVLEMSNRARVVEDLLHRDLGNLTVEPRPHIGKVIPNGYFEYVEGPGRDLRSPFGVDGDRDGITSSFDVDDNNATLNSRRFAAGFNPADSKISYLGDVDDILAMTVRSKPGESFRGRYFNVSMDPTIDGTTDLIESSYAEVVWWTTLSDANGDDAVAFSENVRLFRRVLLITPDLNLPIVANVNRAKAWLAASDVSARMELAPSGGIQLVANSLQDLANRRNRFARHSAAYSFVFPFPLNREHLAVASRSSITGSLLGSNTYSVTPDGSDIVLTDIAAFDVRVFSPDCWVANLGGVQVEPSDPGFDPYDGDGDGVPFSCDTDDSTANQSPSGVFAGAGRFGAFVDLAHHGSGQFSRPTGPTGWDSVLAGEPPRNFLNYEFVDIDGSVPVAGLIETVFDTWTPEYESDGLNQDPDAIVDYAPATDTSGAAGVVGGDSLIDEGTDGIDNDNVNGPDDFNERETQPPYNHPIHGLKVTIRLVEKQSGEVRQSSVVQSYGVQ